MQKLRQRRAMGPACLMYAASGHDADMLYATRFYADDPFLWWEVGGRRHLALSPLEIDRAKPVARGRVHAMGEFFQGAKKQTTVALITGVAQAFRVRSFLVPGQFPAGLLEQLRHAGLKVAVSSEPFFPERARKTKEEIATLTAALAATAIAEWFRNQGRNVLFMMDSVTRFAMAQREIGLAVGEPPASRGYPPSVFSLLPRLLERTGMGERGAITAFYTVLVEGDDLNEPVADTVRGILDGHIVLTRSLATANHFPAIDVLESVSRLNREVSSPAQLADVGSARDLMALYRRHEDLISIGAYNRGSNPRLDFSVERQAAFDKLLRQDIHESSRRAQAHEQLAKLVATPG